MNHTNEITSELEGALSLGRSLKALAQPSTPELIASMIRDAISTGEILPGSQLREAQLAEQLAVSRGPVREAIQRLIQEGIVRAEKNRGVFVPELTAARIADTYLAREALERMACEIILRSGDTAALRALATCVQEMGEAHRIGDSTQLRKADLDFHRRLLEASGSEHLNRMFDTLMHEVHTCLSVLSTGGTGRNEQVVREHRDILEALGTEDSEAVAKAIHVHMASAVSALTAEAGTHSSESNNNRRSGQE